MKGYLFAIRLIGLAAVVLTVAGCGGGGGGSNGPASAGIASPFAGQWAGQWDDPDGNEGPLEVTVATNGRMTLLLSHPEEDAVGGGDGTVRPDGTFTINYQYTGGPRMSATGTLTPTSTGVSGNLIVRDGSEMVGTARFSLRRR